MSQTFPDVPATTKLKDSRALLLQRDVDLQSCFSGTGFPASPIEGQECWRTDQGLLYRYISGNWVPQPYLRDDENLVINGDFWLWQRAASHSVSGYGSADRWPLVIQGGSVTMSQVNFTLGDTLGSVCPWYFNRMAVSGQSLTTDYALRAHRIESVYAYAGQEITVCGWARRSSGAGDMDLEFQQYFGTGGSPSTTVNTRAGRITTSGSWAPFAVTVTVPSVAGKVLGSNGDDYLALHFWSSAGSTQNARTGSLGLQTVTHDLWGVHIRKGRVPVEAVSRYSQRTQQTNWLDCLRYFNADVRATIGGGATPAASGRLWYSPLFWPVPMRAVPTVTKVSESLTLMNAGTIDMVTTRGARYSATNTTNNDCHATVIVKTEAEI